MKTRISLVSTLASVLCTGAALSSRAENWQTVDEFQYVDGVRALGSDIGTDPSGQILYAVGSSGVDPSDATRLAIVNASYDQGATWTTLPLFPSASAWEHNRAFASSGNRLFVGGNGGNSSMVNWFIRESTDGGLTWTSADSLPGNPSGCADIAIHPITGDVYASGSSGTNGRLIRRRAAGASQFTTVYAAGPTDIGSGWAIGFLPNGSVVVAGDKVASDTGLRTWSVLRSATGAAGTWQVVDTFSDRNFTGRTTEGILVTRNGTLYVSGWAYNLKTGKNDWIVRTSTDNGNTWTVSDDFNYGGTAALHVFEMTQDAAGNIYVAGHAPDASGISHWLVRKGTATTQWVKQGKNLVPVTTIAWTTSDSFQFVPGRDAMAIGLTIDSSGNIFACGRAADAADVDHWIVRKLGQ